MKMKQMTLVVLFDKSLEHVLFCQRTKPPYEGKLNFVGGKIEPGETKLDCAYREVEEETGLNLNHVDLVKFMETTYYKQSQDGIQLVIFGGVLDNYAESVNLIKEKNPLFWIPVQGTNFFDSDIFAGDGNIATIMIEAMRIFIPWFFIGQYITDCGKFYKSTQPESQDDTTINIYEIATIVYIVVKGESRICYDILQKIRDMVHSKYDLTDGNEGMDWLQNTGGLTYFFVFKNTQMKDLDLEKIENGLISHIKKSVGEIEGASYNVRTIYRWTKHVQLKE